MLDVALQLKADNAMRRRHDNILPMRTLFMMFFNPSLRTRNRLIALVFGISVHEFAHAAAATWLGDPLPGRQGRLTLAPAAHLDVMGSLMFLIGGFGWGKPVQYNPYALRGNPRTGQAIIAAAGPFTNFFLAIVVAILTRIAIFVLDTRAWFLLPSSPERTLIELLAWIVYFNLVLSFFNLMSNFPARWFYDSVRHFAGATRRIFRRDAPIRLFLF